MSNLMNLSVGRDEITATAVRQQYGPIELKINTDGNSVVIEQSPTGQAEVVIWASSPTNETRRAMERISLTERGNVWELDIPRLGNGSVSVISGGMVQVGDGNVNVNNYVGGGVFSSYVGDRVVQVGNVAGDVRIANGQVWIDGVLQTGNSGASGGQVTVTVYLPDGSSAYVEASGGSIRHNSAVLRKLDFRLLAGSVHSRGSVDELTGNVSGGSVRAAEVGQLDVQANAGSVAVDNVTAGGRASVNGGSIKVGSTVEGVAVHCYANAGSITGYGTVDLGDSRAIAGSIRHAG